MHRPKTIARVLPWRPKVLRSCDMEYGMLHLIFSLPHAWGGTTRSGTLPLLFESGGFLLAHYQPQIMTHLAPRSFTRVQTHYLGEVHSLLHYHGQRSENSSCDSALPSMEVSKLR